MIIKKKIFVFLGLSFFLIFFGFFLLKPKFTSFVIQFSEEEPEILIPKVSQGSELSYYNYKYSNTSGILADVKPYIFCKWKPPEQDDGWKNCVVVINIEDKRKIKTLLTSPKIDLIFENDDVRNIQVGYSESYTIKDEVYSNISLTNKNQNIKSSLKIGSKSLDKNKIKINIKRFNFSQKVLKVSETKYKRRIFRNFYKFQIKNLSKNYNFTLTQNLSILNETNISETINNSFENKTSEINSQNSTLQNSSLVLNAGPENNSEIANMPENNSESGLEINQNIDDKNKTKTNDEISENNQSSLKKDLSESDEKNNSFEEDVDENSTPLKSESSETIVNNEDVEDSTKSSDIGSEENSESESSLKSGDVGLEQNPVVVSIDVENKPEQDNLNSASKIVGNLIKHFSYEDYFIDSSRPFAIKIKFEIPKYSSNRFDFKIQDENFEAYIDPEISSCGELDTENSVYLLSQDIASSGTCFTISANNITLDCQGHKINYSSSDQGYGIYSNKSSISIRNCIIQQINQKPESSGGMYFVGSENLNLTNNTLKSDETSGFGIYISGGSNNKISYNIFNFSGNYSQAIYLESNQSLINQNSISISGVESTGIYFTNSARDLIILNNTIDIFSRSSYGLFGDAGTDVNISNNFIENLMWDSSCIYSEIGNGLNIINNTFISNGTESYGIFLSEVSESLLRDNKINISSGVSGIYFEELSGNNLIQSNILNLFYSDSYGIYDVSSGLNNYTENQIIMGSNDSFGFSFYSGENNSVLGNVIESSGFNNSGILLSGVYNFSVFLNNLSFSGNSSFGIKINNSNYGNISFNNISIFGDDSYAIFLDNLNSQIFSKNVLKQTSDSQNIKLFFVNSATSLRIDKNTFLSNGENDSGCVFLINVSNSRIFENNLTLNAYSSFAFFLNVSNNNNFSINVIIVNGSDSSGISFINSSFNLFSGEKINVSGTSDRALDFRYLANSNNFSFIEINLLNTSTKGLFFGNFSYDNLFSNFGINALSSDSNAVYIFSNVNFSVFDSIFDVSQEVSYDILIADGVSHGSWNFVNTTVDDVAWSEGSEGNLNVSWYLDVVANYTNKTFMNNLNISAYDNEGILVFSELTNESGRISKKILTDYTQSSVESRIDYSNYSVIAYGDFQNKTELIHLNQNRFLNFLFPIFRINLNYPENNSVEENSSLITFNYEVFDENISNCSLFINNNLNKTNSSIIRGNNSFELNIANGNYFWDVRCFLDGVLMRSNVYNFSVLVPENSGDSSSSSSGGGSGSSSGSSSGGESLGSGLDNCKPLWKCSIWSDCIHGKQLRDCINLNPKCNKKKPDTTRKCWIKKKKYKKNILFDVGLKLTKKRLSENQNLEAIVNLLNIGVPGRVNASVFYEIRDAEQNVIYEEQEIVPLETQIEFLKSFPNLDLNPGEYSLIVNLTYPGQTEPAYSQEKFVVLNNLNSLKSNLIFIFILMVLISAIFIVLLSLKNVINKNKTLESSFKN